MSRVLFLIAVTLTSTSAFAIRGDYLPESQLPHNVCRIVIGNLNQRFQPITTNGREIKTIQPLVLNTKDHFVCSANLISSDMILTAAHCYEGSNEWASPRVIMPFPKVDETGKRPDGCEGIAYLKKPECHGDIHQVRIFSDWQNVRIECPNPNGEGFITREIPENMGLPNPFYGGRDSGPSTRHSRANFDFAFYKLSKPITEIKPMQVEWDFKKQWERSAPNEFEEPNPMKDQDICRSFGYGTSEIVKADGSREMEEKRLLDGSITVRPKTLAGILKGANTPPAKLTPNYISVFVSETNRLPGIGWVDHGDSGGAIMCRGRNDRVYKLYGVVSRGLNKTDLEKIIDEGRSVTEGASFDDLEMMKTLIADNYYSTLPYNRDFVEYMTKNAPFPRSLDRAFYWSLTQPYQKQRILIERKETKECIRSAKKNGKMSLSTYREYYRKNESMLDDLYESIEKETKKYGNDPGLYLAKIQGTQFLEKNRFLLWECQGEVYFSDR